MSLPGNDFLCWLHFSYSSHSSVYFQHKQDWLLVSYFAACIISCVVCWEGWFSCPTRSIMYVVALSCLICHSFLSLSLPGNDFLCWLHFPYSSYSSVYFHHNQDWLHVPYFFAACIISSVVCWGGWFSCPPRNMNVVVFCCFYLLFLSSVVPSWQRFSLLATFFLFVSFFCLFSPQARFATRIIFFCCLHYFLRSLLGRVVF